MKAVIVLLSSLFCSSSLFAQPSNMPNFTEPGKCYAKCLIPDEYETVQKAFSIYTGENPKEVIQDSVYFKIEDDSGDLIYLGRIDDLNQTEKAQINTLEKIVFLADEETETDDLVEEIVSYKKLVSKGGLTEWYEVICGDKVNSSLIGNLQKRLIELDYLKNGYNPGQYDNMTKSALIDFQRSTNLPSGQLSIMTMEALDIPY